MTRCEGMPVPSIPQGGATAAVNGRDKFSEMRNDSAVEYLVIEEGRVSLRTRDAGEARAYYLGSERSVDVFAARLKWGPSQEVPQGGDLREDAAPLSW